MSNSTQLPRIAEEKDSPTGTKSDDYSSKEIGGEKSEKQSTSSRNQVKDADKTQSDKRQVGDGKVSSQCSKKEENSQSGTSQTSSNATNLQRHCQTSERFIASSSSSPPHKTHGSEQKNTGKGNTEVHPEIKKILKRYKADSGDGAHPSAHDSGAVSGKEKKNN